MSAAGTPVLERARSRFAEIVARERLDAIEVSVRVVPLAPEEAIGHPRRRDFPIIVGKERVIEADVLGTKGQAFTDSPQDYAGTLREVVALDLNSNRARAIFVAALNAALSHLGMVRATVHCKDEDPEQCAWEIAKTISARFGDVKVGLIGLNPAIAERLVDEFGASQVRITDLCRDNIGKRKFGVEVWDGEHNMETLVRESDVVVFTGTTLVNGTFDGIWSSIQEYGKRYLVYGITAAGACHLFGIDRICPCGATR